MHTYNYIIFFLFKLISCSYIRVNYTTCNSVVNVVCDVKLPYNSAVEWRFNNKVIFYSNNTLKFKFNNNLFGNYTCKTFDVFNKIELKLITEWITSEEKIIISSMLIAYLIISWMTILTLSFKIDRLKRVINLHAILIWITILGVYIQYMLKLSKGYSFIDVCGIVLITVLLFSSIFVNVLTLLKIKKKKCFIVIIILKTITSVLFFLTTLVILFYCYKSIFGSLLIYKLLIINVFELSHLVILFILPVEFKIEYKKLIILNSNLNL
ncbi:128L [Yaba monkey tumor virus]|uniref:128L n=1 Tax=Yaba monkey tumor virus (strain VR587) TaxID=928314 RepID=Q6TUP1_YMTV5|nr:CD47-like protein [Yaba monkey tumor virus]AAR07485.1 128L [Yaba monkey tumor virus]